MAAKEVTWTTSGRTHGTVSRPSDLLSCPLHSLCCSQYDTDSSYKNLYHIPAASSRADKVNPPIHPNMSSNIGNGLSLAPPSMLREASITRELSFSFNALNTPTVNEPVVTDLEMPQLSRNHSLFGYLEVPSLSRNQSLSRTYEDPFGTSPRGKALQRYTDCL